MRVHYLIGFLSFAVVLLYSQSQRGQSGMSDHYQLEPAEVMVEVDEGGNLMPMHVVFLLNNQDGRVWRYEPSHEIKGADGRKTVSGEMFFPVGVLPNNPK